MYICHPSKHTSIATYMCNIGGCFSTQVTDKVLTSSTDHTSESSAAASLSCVWRCSMAHECIQQRSLLSYTGISRNLVIGHCDTKRRQYTFAQNAEIIFITRLSSKFVTESSLKMPSPYLKRVTTNPVNVTLYLINRHQQPGCFCITLYTKCTCMHINNHRYTYKHTV